MGACVDFLKQRQVPAAQALLAQRSATTTCPPQLHAAETSPPLHEGPFWATLLMGAASAPATLWPERRWPAQLPEAATCPPRTGWTGYFMGSALGR